MTVVRTLPLLLVLALAACKPAEQTPAPVVESKPAEPAAQTPAATPSDARATRWQCGDVRVTTRFNENLDAITLLLTDRSIDLQEIPAESGARFSDGAGNEFWSRGKQVTLTLAGQDTLACSKTRELSPAAAAQARGAAYRFTGNEPGWLVEVDAGVAPSLRAELDYGERKIQVAKMQPLGGARGFKGTTADGVPVELHIDNKPCADGMSGEQFKAAGELKIGDDVYRGCGGMLEDKRG